MYSKTFLFFLTITLATSISGCGGISSQTAGNDFNNASFNNNGNGNGNNNNNNNNNNGNNNPNPQPSNTPSTPTYTGNFSLTGIRSLSGSQTAANTTKIPSFYTDSILSFTFTGNSAGTVSSTGSSIYSSCISFNVAIYDSSTNSQIGGTQRVYVSTDNSSNGSNFCFGSPDGQAHPTADFSKYLTQGIQSSVYAVLSDAYSDTCGPNTSPRYGQGYINFLTGITIYMNCYRELYYTWTVTGGYSVQTN